jgi:hypothetical protein
LQGFEANLPREKVHLHFDNTSYRAGDNIWFACYVTDGGRNADSDLRPSRLSRTLHVELLNPGGEVVARRTLRIENGRASGSFPLTHTPFYSGFYEVRAYTKYMLNDPPETIFSRLLPVYDAPRQEGNFTEKRMQSYNTTAANYPMRRPRPERRGAIDVRFFPEGGNLVQGVPSRVAFEATDQFGQPIDITLHTIESGKLKIENGRNGHSGGGRGRGVFQHTPGEIAQQVEVEYEGRTHVFTLPQAHPQGVVMSVDNLSHADSIAVTLRRNGQTPPALFGVATQSGGRIRNVTFAHLKGDSLAFRLPKTGRPAGVSRIVLFDSYGAIVADRLVFVPPRNMLTISAKTDSVEYAPHAPVEMEFSVTDSDSRPVATTFSLSVRDGAGGEIADRTDIATDLLLTSEIRGYVHNPAWYFERPDDPERLAALDILLMVQGWRRYSWAATAAADLATQNSSLAQPFELKYAPEQAIDMRGRVVTINRLNNNEIPRAGVDVSLMLSRPNPDGGNVDSLMAVETLVTDSLGRFGFSVDVEGRWNMILSSSGGRRNQILLDRLFSPPPRRYEYAELSTTIIEPAVPRSISTSPSKGGNEQREFQPAAGGGGVLTRTSSSNFSVDKSGGDVPAADSIQSMGVDKVNVVEAVTVRTRGREQAIRHHRATATAHYDPAAEIDDIIDATGYSGTDIHAMLKATNPHFSTVSIETPLSGGMPDFTSASTFRGPTTLQNVAVESPEPEPMETHEFLIYKGRLAAVVVDYELVGWNTREFFEYRQLPREAIRSVYVNERLMEVVLPYVDIPATMTMDQIFETFGCVVFLETWPEGEINVGGGRGTRKTFLEGYSSPVAFSHPDYSVSPPGVADYRRTLYWNPAVATDSLGRARVSFFNNGRASSGFFFRGETVSSLGEVGVIEN